MGCPARKRAVPVTVLAVDCVGKIDRLSRLYILYMWAKAIEVIVKVRKGKITRYIAS